MKYRLPKNLSPKAKKTFLTAREGDIISCLLQISPSSNIHKLQQELKALGGIVRSWTEDTRLMSVDLNASQLQKLAELDGVIYIETGEKYGQ